MVSAADIRKRKKLSTEDNNGKPPLRKKNLNNKKSNSNLKFSFLCLVISVSLLLLFLTIYTDSNSIVEDLVSKLGYERPHYAVIIDAGSTGSRVLAYKFHKSYIDSKLYLDKEIFVEKKPGLSSFADNPEKGVETINYLLDAARKFVPKEKWADTPLVLKATAGLRLLPEHKADAILNAVRELFARSEFAVDADAVEIMDGTDEGIYSWLTVNLLLGRISKSNQAAALDLGGGSTQVTFSPADVDQIPIYKKHVETVHIFDHNITVFTNSYLRLGLMAVRHAVFTNSLPKNQTSIQSACVNPIIKDRPFTYHNTNYLISGISKLKSTNEKPVVNFEDCLNSIKQVILPLVNPKPLTLKDHMIAAFSYYFERAIESGLVDIDGGEITVSSFRTGAKEICRTANADQPYMCFDLTFISALLKEGFGLQDNKKILLYKKIKGHEISWALGCAYKILTKKERLN